MIRDAWRHKWVFHLCLHNSQSGRIVIKNNDFDDSMAFWPDLSSGSDELVRSYNAIEFRETCDKNHVKGFKSKFPAQQKKLLDVLGKLDENSNPVIQVVTLKNN